MLNESINDKKLFSKFSIATGTGTVSTNPRAFAINSGVIKANYILIVLAIVGTMPAGTVVTTKYYNSGTLLDTVSTTLAGKANGAIKCIQTSEFILAADEVQIDVAFQQGTLYTSDIFANALDTLQDNYLSSNGNAESCSFVVTGNPAESAGTIVVVGQLKDILGANVAAAMLVKVWLSSDAAGTTPAAATSIADGGVGSIIKAVTAATYIDVLTDATGAFDLDIVGTDMTRYLNISIEGKGVFRTVALVWAAGT